MHLSDYVLAEEQSIAKLTLSADDQQAYTALLAGDPLPPKSDLVSRAYAQLKGFVDELAPSADEYRGLIDLVEYLDRKVQVLLAVATGLPEAYVIFETLNDRGADLTTADLLKNYLFSEAGRDGITYAQAAWTRMTATFDKPDDFVKFLRHEYMARRGHVTNRGLYKALQRDINGGSKAVRRYLADAEMALGRFRALKEPDDSSWSSQSIEVRDSLLALRRFRFETNTPLLLAAFATWKHSEATKFVEIVTAWSVRAWVAGTIGGGVAEKAFCDAAAAVSSGVAKTPDEVRPYMKDLVPDDAAFRQAFLGLGPVDTTRAKYLLARLERQHWMDIGKTPEGMPDWSSKAVSVEHIFARSSKRERFSTDEEFEEFTFSGIVYQTLRSSSVL